MVEGLRVVLERGRGPGSDPLTMCGRVPSSRGSHRLHTNGAEPPQPHQAAHGISRQERRWILLALVNEFSECQVIAPCFRR